ncbi:MAG TPA: AMP-binding protein [Sporichthya sp.]|nr:AMP-binding protein [Sporichthya sp.]
MTPPLPHLELVRARAKSDPNGACVEDEHRALTNAEFADAVAVMAQRLRHAGVAAGDTVGVLLPNCVDLVVTMFGAWTLRAALTPLNPALTEDEALYQLQDSTSVVLVGDRDVAALAARAGAAHLLAGPDSPRPDSPAVPGLNTADPCTAEDFALIIYTSGTTGRPKGVLLDHANLAAMTASIVERLHLGADDGSLLVLPLFHVNGLVVGVLSPLRAGGRVLISPRFAVDTFWHLVETRRPTYFSAVPTIYALLDSRTDREVDSSSLRFALCGAAPMPADQITLFERRFGVPLVEGYGLSEGTVASTLNPLDGVRKPGTVGLPLPGQQVAIRSRQGRPAAAGERGEVVIRGANVMRGYLGQPEATAATIRDGWLHTGDVGYLDGDGYLVLVDRIKDMIIRGGENVYPQEIEAVLYRHPAVVEAAVIGQPDAVMGEVPVAFVALRPGSVVDPEEFQALCRSSLAKYKQPTAIRILPSLPKNAVGKIAKRALRDQAVPAAT